MSAGRTSNQRNALVEIRERAYRLALITCPDTCGEWEHPLCWIARRADAALRAMPDETPRERHRGDEVDPKLAQQAWYHVQQEAVVNGDLLLKDAIVNIWTRITGIPSSPKASHDVPHRTPTIDKPPQ